MAAYSMYDLGCPMWANDKWKGSLFRDDCRSSEFLAQYARYFNSVEGNTTFYADPSPDTVARWSVQVPADFGFMLKVPKRLSHDVIDDWPAQLQQWLCLLLPLKPQIRSIHLQLPARVGPAALGELAAMLEHIRNHYPCVVEVRHPDFFDKGPAEQALHQLLRSLSCERLCFDSRALFSVQPTTPALRDAQAKKPRLPVHVVALTERPVVRFIGLDDIAANQAFYAPWLGKVATWVQQGLRPALYFHTPDNRLAPQLARQFATDLLAQHQISHPCLAAWPCELQPQQSSLF